MLWLLLAFDSLLVSRCGLWAGLVMYCRHDAEAELGSAKDEDERPWS